MEGRPGNGGCPRSGWHVREACISAAGSDMVANMACSPPGAPLGRRPWTQVLLAPRHRSLIPSSSSPEQSFGGCHPHWGLPAAGGPQPLRGRPGLLQVLLHLMQITASLRRPSLAVHQAGGLFDSAPRDTVAGHLSSGHRMGAWPL